MDNQKIAAAEATATSSTGTNEVNNVTSESERSNAATATHSSTASRLKNLLPLASKNTGSGEMSDAKANKEANADTVKKANHTKSAYPALPDPFQEIRKSAEKKLVGLKDYQSVSGIRNNEWLSSRSINSDPHPAPAASRPQYETTKNIPNNTNTFSESFEEPVPPPLPSGMKHLASGDVKTQSKLPQPTDIKMTVEELEEVARRKAIWNPFELLFLGNIAALKVVGFYLITLETFITIGLTTGLTVYWYNKYYDAPAAEWNGGGLDFVLLAFAVTSPMSAAIGMAFQRRERALIALADFKSFTYHLYMAHCLWDWTEGGSMGREKAQEDGRVDWIEHCDAVLAQLIGIGDELSRFLTLPTVSRSRHRMTKKGRKEAARTIEVAYQLLESMSTQRLTRLVLYSERLKKIGLPSGEISRIRQYERFLSNIVEQLRMIKMYRTPQALRSFARIFTVLLPPFYAPTYAQVAKEMDSLAVGLCFGIITALALTALFESLQILEDPFTAFLALDGIDCREELEVLNFSHLIQTRRLTFPNAPEYPAGRRAALTHRNFPNKKIHQVGMPPAQKYHTGTASSQAKFVTSPASVHSGITFVEEGTNTAMPGDDTVAIAEETDHTVQELGETLPLTEVITSRESVFQDDWTTDGNTASAPRLRHRRNVSFFNLDQAHGGQQQQSENPSQSGSRHRRTDTNASVAGSVASPYHHRRTNTNTSAAGFLNFNSSIRLPER